MVTKETNTSLPQNNGFDWDNEIQAQLLSAYNIGFIFANIFGGPLCALFGPKRVMAVGLFANGLSHLASPLASLLSHWLVFFLQVAIGASVSHSFWRKY